MVKDQYLMSWRYASLLPLNFQPSLIPPLAFLETPAYLVLVSKAPSVVSTTLTILALCEQASALFFCILHCTDP